MNSTRMMHRPAVALTFALVLLTSTVGTSVTYAEMATQTGSAYSHQIAKDATVTSKPASAVESKVNRPSSGLTGTMQAINTSNSGMCSDYLGYVAVDRMQNAWFSVGGGAGIVCYLSSTGQWDTYHYYEAGVFPDANGVWIGSINAYYRQFDGNIITYTNSNSQYALLAVRNIFVDLDNNVWLTGGDTVQRKTPLDQWTTYKQSNSGLNSVNPANTMVDHLRRVWISTWGQGVYMLDTNGTWTVYTTVNTNGGLINNIVPNMVEDQAGNIWFSVYGGDGGGGGVSKLAPSGVWTNYRSSNSPLISEIVNHIDIDIDQNIWIGTRSGANVLSPDGTWTTFSDVGCVQKFAFTASGDVWMASYFGGGAHLFHPDHPLTTASTLTSMAPTTVAAGTPALTLTEQGANFTPRSMILVDGNPRPTHYISPSLVTGRLQPDDLAATRTLSVTVYNVDFSTTSSTLPFKVGDTPATSLVSGRVTDPSGNPIPFVAVASSSGVTITTSGAFTFTNVLPGTYVLTPTLTGYTFSPPTRTVSVPPNATGQDFTGVVTASNSIVS